MLSLSAASTHVIAVERGGLDNGYICPLLGRVMVSDCFTCSSKTVS